MAVKFSKKTFDAICKRISEGESLRKICSDDDMPDKSTVMRRLDKEENGHLRDQYARAREEQADLLFEDCLEIADQYDPDADKSEGGVEHIQRARLRIDTRKWMAGKLRPKKYGDKLDLDGNVAFNVNISKDDADL